MTNEIERSSGQIERTWTNGIIRTSREQFFAALAPMFAMLPDITLSDETLNVYYMLLADIEPDVLSQAVIFACREHKYPTQPITVAAIREQLPDKREPGPRSESEDNYILPEPPPGGFKMFRLPEDEDKRQRMERLRNTVKWEKYYG